MNTDDELMKQAGAEKWLEWLDGGSCPEVEALLAERPGLEEMRGRDAAARAALRAAVPASEEPPYADFFNSRIQKMIREEERAGEGREEKAETGRSFWERFRWVLAPVAAAACFLVGMKVGTGPAAAGGAVAGSASVYTPDAGVRSSVVSEEDGSVVIVLDGLEAIPDSVDLMKTAGEPARDGWFVKTSDDENDAL